MTENSRPPQSAAAAQRLNDALKRLRARLRTESGQHAIGLTVTQLSVLGSIVRQGPITAARLAAVEHVSAQAVAQNLAVLKAAGLVHSEPDPEDGRRKLISADPTATEMIGRLLAGRDTFLARAIDQLATTPDELKDVEKAIDLLERLAAADPGDGAP
ncbi:MarR family winged helix-turn-helix transcriptional regulator [Streptomyces sp. NPDC059002]|uniref:MarR family winged helix-turn-helix transcriptional regulator n=1 Tax=Streptomyces sp. NPDC059002 TaxID=3346690 RepID=UPI0036C0A115